MTRNRVQLPPHKVLFCIVLVIHHACSLSSTGTTGIPSPNYVVRKSTLLSWEDRVVLGHCIEERNDEAVTVQIWLENERNDDDDVLTLTFPETETAWDGLASQLWPAALASSILLRSPEFRPWLQGKSVVELGSGRGLTGLVAAVHAKSCLLTDNDATAVEVLTTSTCPTNDDRLEATLSTRQLDWRDTHGGNVPFMDLVLGSDIAYYFYLLRPLMDTIRAFMDAENKDVGNNQKPSTLVVTGQANRESLWDLYKNIQNGCYNQLTDVKEPPWQGTTRMLLYNLQLSPWCPTLEACNGQIDGLVPISLIVHHGDMNADAVQLSPFEMFAHTATQEDDDSIMKSF
jgi:Lysine methyltransferase